MVTPASHPYSDLTNVHFWSRSVANLSRHEIHPLEEPKFLINKSDRIATMGSCFAQHVARSLQIAGLNYYIAETPRESLTRLQIEMGHWQTFSARYGNVYSVRQALHLTERAFAIRDSTGEVWRIGDGYADPHRPGVEPLGFQSIQFMQDDRQRHLNCVRELLTNSDVLIFTLGLSEGWESKVDGTCYPSAPGAVAGSYDANIHQFINYSLSQIQHDLHGFLDLLTTINPRLRIILTVSPVPLAATYTSRHVLVANSLSKSKLVATAMEAESYSPNVCYFPSYEIINGLQAGSYYFENDLRTVSNLGIQQVMNQFLSNYVVGRFEVELQNEVHEIHSVEMEAVRAIVCEESLLDDFP